MKWELVFLVLVLCGAGFAQAPTGSATYAKNGVLIRLTNLAPLRNCSIRAMEGKMKDIERNESVVTFNLKSKEELMTFQIALDRLGSSERKDFQKDLLRKGLRLRASGYACGGRNDTLETISIERVY